MDTVRQAYLSLELVSAGELPNRRRPSTALPPSITPLFNSSPKFQDDPEAAHLLSRLKPWRAVLLYPSHQALCRNRIVTMAYPSKPQLTVLEKISLIFNLLVDFPIRATFHSLRMGWLAARHGLSVGHSILCAILKCAFLSVTPRQVQNLLPTGPQVVREWLPQKRKQVQDPEAKARLIEDMQPLSSGLDSRLIWIGDRTKAKKVVLLFHGGGFVLPFGRGHLEWVWHTYVAPTIGTKDETATAILRYTLAPGGRFPTQLVQAAAAFQAVRDLGFKESDIVVGGDSAGGHLSLQFMGHILHPHPSAVPITLNGPLRAVFLVSPWAGLDYASKSMVDNDARDLISIPILHSITKAYATTSELSKAKAGANGWLDSLNAPAGWFDGLSKVTKEVYVTVGVHETLADQGRKIAHILSTANPDVPVDLVEFPKDLHDAILIESMRDSFGDAAKAMKAWYQSVLDRS